MIERPMLPNSAASRTVHGVIDVIPSCFSYIMQRNAMGNRMPAKLTLSAFLTMMTISSIVSRKLNTFMSGK